MEGGEVLTRAKQLGTERERRDGGGVRRGKVVSAGVCVCVFGGHQAFLINIHFPGLSCCCESGCCITKQRASDPK